jgi:hypothetical protein
LIAVTTADRGSDVVAGQFQMRHRGTQLLRNPPQDVEVPFQLIVACGTFIRRPMGFRW